MSNFQLRFSLCTYVTNPSVADQKWTAILAHDYRLYPNAYYYLLIVQLCLRYLPSQENISIINIMRVGALSYSPQQKARFFS